MRLQQGTRAGQLDWANGVQGFGIRTTHCMNVENVFKHENNVIGENIKASRVAHGRR
ncbi:hypothetical protein LZ32DRAFT_599887 [Colletotrichum eremochloae]|nr:hypothetical protein LZ32DRAFT_599887 [Colletotrichum eremochloae]